MSSSALLQAVANRRQGDSTPASHRLASGYNTPSLDSAFDLDTDLRSGSPKITLNNALHLPCEDDNQRFEVGSEYDDSKPTCVVISGGSGANALVDAILQCFSDIAFIMPISDNGGSSSELLRVMGGPSIDMPSEAIKRLLAFRLSGVGDSHVIKQTWLEIVEGRHPLWRGIPSDRRETIRAFLVHLESELLKRAHKRFNFKLGCVGNFFLAGALSFFRSIESAILLFQNLTGIPERLCVIPCIFTNSVATIAAELKDGTIIVGQTDISHPTLERRDAVMAIFEGNSVGLLLGDDDKFGHDTPLEDETQAKHIDHNIAFSKSMSDSQVLSAPINDVYYINSFGKQVWPKPNPKYLAALNTHEILIYSCGSLFTSIIPCLAIQGVGRAIAMSKTLKKKILLLNAVHDRETPVGTTATDFVLSIQRCLNRNTVTEDERFAASDYFTHLVYLKSGQIPVDREGLGLLGINCVEIKSAALFTDMNVYSALSDILSET